LLAHGRWFSPGTPTSSTTKTGRHKIAENIAESGVKHNKSINQSIKRALFQLYSRRKVSSQDPFILNWRQKKTPKKPT
jgi:hypothetical protein